jgi:hypothetical protein
MKELFAMAGTAYSASLDERIKQAEQDLEANAKLLAELKEEKARRELSNKDTRTEPESSVIIFSKQFEGSSRKYSYAARRWNGYWYLTQDGASIMSPSIPKMTWQQLIDWIGDKDMPIYVVTDWRQI